MTLFKIHPAIGIARLGNSEGFYLAPEQPGALPIQCDSQGRAIVDQDGTEKRVDKFKDVAGRVKRQAARFRVFVYDGASDTQGCELKIGDKFNFELETAVSGRQTVEGQVVDIEWTVHLANKKAAWYRFMETDGMHGYPSSHPLRNPEVTQPDARRKLIIDPGPQTVSCVPPEAQHKRFAQGHNSGYPQTFPPHDIAPNPITTLGELKVNQQDDHVRLIVLGGFGNAGSTDKSPVLTQYANNDGWFDDISDGPVTARIKYQWVETYTDQDGKEQQRHNTGAADVDVPAWVVVGYPRYAPELVDMITMDEAMYDLFVRHFAYRPQIYGVPPYDQTANSPKTEQEFHLWRSQAGWNPNYYPKFYQEIWPILRRPDLFGWVYVFDWFGGSDPHNTGTQGNLDEKRLSTPPMQGEDPNFQDRQFIFKIMRQRGQENLYRTGVESLKYPGYHPRAMPELCGNNPLSNTAPQKFLRMTDTQLFLLQQWAEGKFVNECDEWDESDETCQDPFANLPTTGVDIDRGVLGNVVGGAFCPGAELTWIMLNPAIYSEPYRVKHTQYQAGALSLPRVVAQQDGSPAADLSAGLEPGDLTKYLALPWQADFNQCTEQNIDITYEDWSNIDLDSTGDPAQQELAYNVPWWPAHRPIVVFKDSNSQVYWASGIPENNAGGLQMVTAWQDLGFIHKVYDQESASYVYLLTERNDTALGPLVKPGQRRLGNTKRSDKDG